MVSDRGRATSRRERLGDRFDPWSAPTFLAGADRRGPDRRLRCTCHGGKRRVPDQLVVPPDRHPAGCRLSGCQPICDASPAVGGSQTKIKKLNGLCCATKDFPENPEIFEILISVEGKFARWCKVQVRGERVLGACTRG